MKADWGSFGICAGVIVVTPVNDVIGGGAAIMGDILDRLPELAEAWIPGGGTYRALGFEPLKADTVGGVGPDPQVLGLGNKNEN